ncbi:MAG: STM4012 family radical SAM protein [Gemmataceae bacterium]|nr:STM4012 family radical SAM protein [Gemmataceae bacterium]
MTAVTDRAADLLAGSPYRGYSYAYPHKTAYRPLVPPVSLADAWRGEPTGGLFLYIHVPFCEVRCGFCNLFAQARPRAEVVSDYLGAVARQADAVRAAIGPATYARFAVGGGTPTALDPGQLHRLFDVAERVMGRPVGAVPASAEASPGTADWDRLAVLRERGVTRLSIGVQSFTEAEVRAAGRPQHPAEVSGAVERARSLGFPTINLDLIYGLPGQTVASWLATVRAALRFQPEELFLYPLYVRPLTGLGKSPRAWDDLRLSCYRAARDLLADAGYAPVSMRLFRAKHAPADDAGPAYCVQDDGMVGLGCGARSYTRGLHWSDGYAVGQKEVAALITEYAGRSTDALGLARHGFALDGDEQRRRYVLLTLLQEPGLPLADYERRFGSDMFGDLPELVELAPLGLAEVAGGRLRLTPAGVERSDAVGPWLYSPTVRRRMGDHEWR